MVKVRYRNASGQAIPPHGVFQVSGPVEQQAANGDWVLLAVAPGMGTGPYLIDDGKGTASSGAGSFGLAYRSVEGLVWAAYGCGGGPPTPWMEIGPVLGQFYLNESGTGYLYAGVYDGDNGRLLVMMNSFEPEVGSCSSGTGSSSSSGSGNSSSSSSSGSCPSGCVRVLTDVYCDAGELVLETACAVACGTLSTIRRVNI